MKLFRFLTLLLVLFSGSSRAYDFPVEIYEFMDDSRVAASINAEDLGVSQGWVPFDSAPPLSITDALKAIDVYRVDNADLAGAQLTEVELKQIPYHEQHWHYLVKMSVQDEDGPRSSYFFVLMTGKVIPGIKEPQSVK